VLSIVSAFAGFVTNKWHRKKKLTKLAEVCAVRRPSPFTQTWAWFGRGPVWEAKAVRAAGLVLLLLLALAVMAPVALAYDLSRAGYPQTPTVDI